MFPDKIIQLAKKKTMALLQQRFFLKMEYYAGT